MRRYNLPYNGLRYVLNTNTGEIHDLDNEHSGCNINAIKPEHVYNCDSYVAAQIHASIVVPVTPNGCHYCLSGRDIG